MLQLRYLKTIFLAAARHFSLSLDQLSIMSKSKPEQWYYAVKSGRTPGIYFNWPHCELQVKGFTGAAYKKFISVIEAAEFASGRPVVTKRARSSSPDKDRDAPESKKKATDDKGNDAPGSKKKATDDKDSFTGSAFEDSDGIHVYTDGGCFFNGKAGAQAGIGVYWGKGDPDNVSDKLPGRPTNNRAEIHAAVKAVQIAKRRGIENLILHTDSQFLINGITKWIKGWKKRDWKLSTGGPVINKDDFIELDEALQGINVKWMYVKGHSGNEGNEAVDALAKKGAAKKENESS